MAKNQSEIDLIGGLQSLWSIEEIATVFGDEAGAAAKAAKEAGAITYVHRGDVIGIRFDKVRALLESKAGPLTLTDFGRVLLDAKPEEYMRPDAWRDVRDKPDDKLLYGIECRVWKELSRKGEIRDATGKACGPHYMPCDAMLEAAKRNGLQLRPRVADAKAIFYARQQAAKAAAEAAEADAAAKRPLVGIEAVLAARAEQERRAAEVEAAEQTQLRVAYRNFLSRVDSLSDAEKTDFISVISSLELSNDTVAEHGEALAQSRELRSLVKKLPELRAECDAKRKAVEETKARHERELSAVKAESSRAFAAQSAASQAINKLEELRAKFPIIFDTLTEAANLPTPKRTRRAEPKVATSRVDRDDGVDMPSAL